MIVYFSGTGNSKYVADMIGYNIKDKIINAGDFIKRGEQAVLESDKPWIFISPVYAWQMPRIFQKFIEEGIFSGNKNTYFIITCGDDIGDAKYKNEIICKKKNLKYMGTKAILMPENYIAMFNVPSKEKSDRIILAAESQIAEAVKNIKANEIIKDKKTNILDRFKSGIINSMFYSFFVKADKFYANDKCIGCGKCAEVCVLNNIKMLNIKPEWGKNCTHCMACICGCPVEAIEYGKNQMERFVTNARILHIYK